jgi:hypothetical protein
MNWKRGFFRVWLVLSLAWMAYVGIMFGPSILDPIRDPGERAKTSWTWEEAQSPNLRAPPTNLILARFWSVSALAMSPPIAMLLGGLATAWIFFGFRRP